MHTHAHTHTHTHTCTDLSMGLICPDLSTGLICLDLSTGLICLDLSMGLICPGTGLMIATAGCGEGWLLWTVLMRVTFRRKSLGCLECKGTRDLGTPLSRKHGSAYTIRLNYVPLCLLWMLFHEVWLSLPLFFTDAFPDALNSAGLLNGVWKPATEATITAEVLLLGIIWVLPVPRES